MQSRFYIYLSVSVLILQLKSVTVIAAGDYQPIESILEQRQHNVILQQWELSCAAAALATVFRYQHNLPVTERSVALGLINRPEYLKNPQLVRQRQGFSLLDMKRFTGQIGLHGIGLGNLEFDDLIQRAPVIVPISTNGYPHFVVFLGATSRSVLLADPAFGNVTMSVHKFKESWINYHEIGYVGFVVTRTGEISPPGKLRADFSLFPLH